MGVAHIQPDDEPLLRTTGEDDASDQKSGEWAIWRIALQQHPTLGDDLVDVTEEEAARVRNVQRRVSRRVGGFDEVVYSQTVRAQFDVGMAVAHQIRANAPHAPGPRRADRLRHDDPAELTGIRRAADEDPCRVGLAGSRTRDEELLLDVAEHRQLRDVGIGRPVRHRVARGRDRGHRRNGRLGRSSDSCDPGDQTGGSQGCTQRQRNDRHDESYTHPSPPCLRWVAHLANGSGRL